VDFLDMGEADENFLILSSKVSFSDTFSSLK